MLRDDRRRQKIVLRGHRADDDLVALEPDEAQIADAPQIDEVLGRGEPGFHDGDQGVAAGERTGVLPELREQGDRVLRGRGAMIIEPARNHGAASPVGFPRRRVVVGCGRTGLEGGSVR